MDKSYDEAEKEADAKEAAFLVEIENATKSVEATEAFHDRYKHKVPEKYLALFRRAWNGTSRRDAIRANCLECMCFQYDEVKLCPSPDCPMYAFRLGGSNTISHRTPEQRAESANRLKKYRDMVKTSAEPSNPQKNGGV